MPRNSAGVYTLPAGNPVVAGTKITSTWANTLANDLGNEITQSLDRSGRGGMLVAFKITDGNVGNPGIAFNNETTTGFYRGGAGVLGMSILGNARMLATDAGDFSFVGGAGGSISITRTGGTSLIRAQQDSTSATDFARLNVLHSGTVSGEMIASNTAVFVGTATNHSFHLRTNSVNRITLDTAGNMGLAATPNAWGPLYRAVQITAFGSAIAGLNGGGGSTHYLHNAYNDGTNWRYIGAFRATMLQTDGNGGFSWSQAPVGVANGVVAWAQAMTLDNAGILGVGDGVPGGYVSGTARAVFRFDTATTSYPAIFINGNNGTTAVAAVRMQTGTANITYDQSLSTNAGAGFVTYSTGTAVTGGYRWGVAGTEQMRLILSSGGTTAPFLLLGTTTGAYASASNRSGIEVNGTGISVMALKVGDALRGYIYADASAFYVGSTLASIPVNIMVAGTQMAQFEATNGNMGLGTTASATAGQRLHIRNPTATSVEAVISAGVGNSASIRFAGNDNSIGASGTVVGHGAGNTFSITNITNGAIQFNTANTFRGQISGTGVWTTRNVGTGEDNEVGNRRVRLTATTGATAAAFRSGEGYLATGNITIDGSVFQAGDVITIINNNSTATSINIVQGTGMTLTLAGTTTTGTRTLVQNGMATVIFRTATEALVSGVGVS